MSKTELILLPKFPSPSVLPISVNGDTIHKNDEIRHMKDGGIFYFNLNSLSISKTYQFYFLSLS